MTTLPGSGPRVVWQPDPARYVTDDDYRDAVDDLVRRRLPRVSVSDLRVLEADDGDRALFAESFIDEHGDWFRAPNGTVTRGTRWAPLPPTEVLP